MRKHHVATSLVALAAAMSVVVVPARATEPVAYVPTQIHGSPLSTARSTRNQAMAGAGVADPATSSNAVHNPANLIGDDGVFAWYDYYKLYDAVGVHGVGFAATRTWAGNGVRAAVAVHQLYQSYQPDLIRTVYLPQGAGTSHQVDDHGTAVAAAVGIPVGRAQVAIGFGVERAVMKLNTTEVDAWAVDAGVRVDVPFVNDRGERLDARFGVSILNSGNGFEIGSYQSDSPTHARVGVGARYTFARRAAAPFSGREVSVITLDVDVDAVVNNSHVDGPTALTGLELGLLETFFVRGGTGGSVDEKDGGVSYGAGLAVEFGPTRFHFDLAVTPSRSPVEDTETLVGLSVDYRP